VCGLQSRRDGCRWPQLRGDANSPPPASHIISSKFCKLLTFLINPTPAPDRNVQVGQMADQKRGLWRVFFSWPYESDATTANICPPGPISVSPHSKQSSRRAKSVSRKSPNATGVTLRFMQTPPTGFRDCVESRTLPHMGACYDPSFILTLAQASTIGSRNCRILVSKMYNFRHPSRVR
jgi:hypothetical protein